MEESIRRRALYFVLAALYLLHNDLWLWDNPLLIVGIPVGLVYHVGLLRSRLTTNAGVWFAKPGPVI